MSHKADLDFEALADLAVPQELRLSPNGSRIVYSVRPFTQKSERTVSTLWIGETGKENSARQFTSGLFNDETPRWSPDGKHIAFKSDRAQPGKSVAVYVISSDGGEAWAITPFENESPISKFEWSPDNKFIAYISSDEKKDEKIRKEKEKDDAKVWGEEWDYQRLRCVDVSVKTIDTLVGGERHIKDFSWSPDGEQIIYVEHETPDINSPGFYGARIKLFSRNGKRSDEVLHFPGPIHGIEWGDVGTFFVAGIVPTRSTAAQNLNQLSLEKRTSLPIGGFGWFNCCLDLQKNNSYLAVRSQTFLNDELSLICNDGTSDSSGGTSDFADTEVSKVYSGTHDIAAFDVSLCTAEGKPVTAIIKSDSATPNEVFSTNAVFSIGPMEMSSDPIQISNHNAAIASLEISVGTPIHTKSSDGWDLDGMMFCPTSQPFKDARPPRATVLWVHGGPYSRVTNSFSPSFHYEVPLLLSRGYVVLCPNYRGSSGRGQGHARFAHGQMGTVDYSDCIDVLNKGIELGIVDPSRVVIGGWSQGGFLSYLAVTRPDFKFRGAICGAGVVDWDMMTMTSDAHWVEADLAGGAPWDVDAELREEGPSVEEEAKFSSEFRGHTNRWIKGTAGRHGSAIWHMRNVDTPVLILHGENDVRVPFSQAVAFYRACIHNDVPVKMVSYPREGHFITERAHIIDLLKRMLDFCELHLS